MPETLALEWPDGWYHHVTLDSLLRWSSPELKPQEMSIFTTYKPQFDPLLRGYLANPDAKHRKVVTSFWGKLVDSVYPKKLRTALLYEMLDSVGPFPDSIGELLGKAEKALTQEEVRVLLEEHRRGIRSLPGEWPQVMLVLLDRYLTYLEIADFERQVAVEFLSEARQHLTQASSQEHEQLSITLVQTLESWNVVVACLADLQNKNTLPEQAGPTRPPMLFEPHWATQLANSVWLLPKSKRPGIKGRFLPQIISNYRTDLELWEVVEKLGPAFFLPDAPSAAEPDGGLPGGDGVSYSWHHSVNDARLFIWEELISHAKSAYVTHQQANQVIPYVVVLLRVADAFPEPERMARITPLRERYIPDSDQSLINALNEAAKTWEPELQNAWQLYGPQLPQLPQVHPWTWKEVFTTLFVVRTVGQGLMKWRWVRNLVGLQARMSRRKNSNHWKGIWYTATSSLLTGLLAILVLGILSFTLSIRLPVVVYGVMAGGVLVIRYVLLHRRHKHPQK